MPQSASQICPQVTAEHGLDMLAYGCTFLHVGGMRRLSLRGKQCSSARAETEKVTSSCRGAPMLPSALPKFLDKKSRSMFLCGPALGLDRCIILPRDSLRIPLARYHLQGEGQIVT
jgi:hypothetical protein